MTDKVQYYHPVEKEVIRCNLCEHKCRLKEGSVGLCRVNTNENGMLKCIVQNRPVAVHIDPIEKKPLFHFLKGTKTFSIGTNGCNFRCQWCQNYRISQAEISSIASLQKYEPELIVQKTIENDCRSIAYTYNEPTVFYPYAREIGILAKENDLKNIFVSNGYQTKEIVEDMTLWVDACNIDLKCFNIKQHTDFTGGDLSIVKRNLKILAESGIHLEITTLVIPEYNDSDNELGNIADFIKNQLGDEVPWHVSAFHPDYKMTDKKRTSKETIFRAMELGLQKGLKYVYPGNIW